MVVGDATVASLQASRDEIIKLLGHCEIWDGFLLKFLTERAN